MPRLATLVAGLSAVACVCNKQQLGKDYRHSTNTVIARVPVLHLSILVKSAVRCCACANDQIQITARTADLLQYTCSSHKLPSILTLSSSLSPVPACLACTSTGTTSAVSCSTT